MPAPIGNKNAEKWTLSEAQALFDKALIMSKNDEYDFIGEIARDLDVSRDVFEYLAAKFPELEGTNRKLHCNIEASCFTHAKKGKIKEATAIVNLKSNYGWTDRQQIANTGEVTLHFDKDDANA